MRSRVDGITGLAVTRGTGQGIGGPHGEGHRHTRERLAVTAIAVAINGGKVTLRGGVGRNENEGGVGALGEDRQRDEVPRASGRNGEDWRLWRFGGRGGSCVGGGGGKTWRWCAC